MTAVKVTGHPEPTSAEQVRSILMDAGLHPLPLRGKGYLPIATADQGYFVHVFQEEFDRAVKAIEASGNQKYLWQESKSWSSHSAT